MCMVASAATRNEQWALSRLRVASIWAPNCPQWGPHTGRGARTGGLVDDRTRSTIGPRGYTSTKQGCAPINFRADLSAPCRHDDSIPSSPTVLPASPSGGFHRQCVWFHHLSYLSPTPFTGHDLCDKGQTFGAGRRDEDFKIGRRELTPCRLGSRSFWLTSSSASPCSTWLGMGPIFSFEIPNGFAS